jgi:putative endopeptidase
LHPLGVDALFTFLVDQDEKESHVVSVHVYQGGLGLPDRDFYINDDASVRQTRVAYVRHVGRMLRLLGRSEATAAADATALMRFETALAKASRKLEETRDPLTNYQRIAPAEFTSRYTPSIDWTRRLAAWNLRPEYIVVAQPEYFIALEKILAQTPLAVLKDYLRFHLAAEYAPYLGPALDAENFDFYKRVLTGQTEEKPRWQRALDVQSRSRIAANPLGMMAGRRFVATQFPATAKQRYRDLVQTIVGVYGERIGTLHWMTDATKARAREKLASVDAKVGYPDTWPDYSSLVIGRDSYCENMMNIARWLFRTMLARFGKPVDRTEWRMTPQTYNAYYNPANNEIVLPAAIFVIPGVADRDVDDAVAYAYAGASTIGHEITHGFDDTGRKFDATGNLADWWTAADGAEFEKRAEVLVRQFNAYEALPGFRINGKASLGENIDDFGGLVLALDAFKTTEQYKQGVTIAGMTPLQRFFLAYAYSWMSQEREEQTRRYLLSDVHAPAKWRVLGPLSNLPEFYEAFDVQPGQAMWRAPEERAGVW